MTVESFLAGYFINPKVSELANIIISFTVGFILGPTSFGLIYYILFVLLYEILIFWLSKGLPPYGSPFFRAGYIYAGLAGFIAGRIVASNFNETPLDTEVLEKPTASLEAIQIK